MKVPPASIRETGGMLSMEDGAVHFASHNCASGTVTRSALSA